MCSKMSDAGLCVKNIFVMLFLSASLRLLRLCVKISDKSLHGYILFFNAEAQEAERRRGLVVNCA